jgi:hypothetical protein
MHRLDAPELANPLPFAPAQEGTGSPRIRRPRVFVAAIDGEEFEEAPRGFVSGIGDEPGTVTIVSLGINCGALLMFIQAREGRLPACEGLKL